MQNVRKEEEEKKREREKEKNGGGGTDLFYSLVSIEGPYNFDDRWGGGDWNRTMPRSLAQNQHTRELISARKSSYKHNNKDFSRQVRVTVGDSGLCYCACVTTFKR